MRVRALNDDGVRPVRRKPLLEQATPFRDPVLSTDTSAALGIRVKRGRAYHGIALNVDMDLSPFGAIDPCGYPGLAVTQLKDLGFAEDVFRIGERLAKTFIRGLEHA